MTVNLAGGVWLHNSAETTPNLECLHKLVFCLISQIAHLLPAVNQSQLLVDLCHQRHCTTSTGWDSNMGPIMTVAAFIFKSKAKQLQRWRFLLAGARSTGVVGTVWTHDIKFCRGCVATQQPRKKPTSKKKKNNQQPTKQAAANQPANKTANQQKKQPATCTLLLNVPAFSLSYSTNSCSTSAPSSGHIRAEH